MSSSSQYDGLSGLLSGAGVGGVSPSTLTNGLLCCYSNDGEDTSGNANATMTKNNAPGTATGIFGNTCMDFVRASSQSRVLLAADADPLFDFSGGTVEGSMAWWVRPTSLNSFSGMFSRGTATSRAFFTNTGTTTVRMANEYVSGTGRVQTGVWTHIYVGWDPSGSTSRLSYNGSLSETKSGIAWAAAGIATFFGQLDTGSDFLNGRLDQFSSWDRQLTPTEINELYNGGAGTNFTGITV